MNQVSNKYKTVYKLIITFWTLTQFALNICKKYLSLKELTLSNIDTHTTLLSHHTKHNSYLYYSLHQHQMPSAGMLLNYCHL